MWAFPSKPEWYWRRQRVTTDEAYCNCVDELIEENHCAPKCELTDRTSISWKLLQSVITNLAYWYMSADGCDSIIKMHNSVMLDYKMRITDERLGWLIIGRIENPHCLKCVRCNPCDCISSVNTWVNLRLFREWLVCFERKTFCNNSLVLLLMIHCATHNKVGTLNYVCLLCLLPNITIHFQQLG
jgi:hypothetical protein